MKENTVRILCPQCGKGRLLDAVSGTSAAFIVLFFIPPYTPEMNPIKQIWKELRKSRFKNEVFSTLEKVVDRLCDVICSLTPAVIHSITGID